MDARTFLGLEGTHNPYRWVLPVQPGVCTPEGFLFGGCGLGAAIAALEATTGRPVVWATCQYLSYARPPEVLDLDVTVAVSGHQTTQARATGHVADREVFTVNAALGRRPMEAEGTWAEMPDVPTPDRCARREMRIETGGEYLPDRLEVRQAAARSMTELPGPGMPGGRSSLWAKLPDVLDLSSAALAVLGDYVPFGIGQALGLRAGGNSLDNTLRLGRTVPTEWVLLDIRVHQVVNGFGHGDVHLWSESGTLLATASQSTIVRMWRDAPGQAREG
ncbi:MAG TPA: thioesterase family protein [Acidimicrobiales bacterium]|nr:thioesterase family protein [Acidimicrobiales bacterium]